MEDRELLQRAARAAGASLVIRTSVGGLIRAGCDGAVAWRPLEDDGDAFRLQARLNLNLGFDLVDAGIEVSVMAVWDGGPDEVSEIYEGSDAGPSMRRAIVRAAAAIAG